MADRRNEANARRAKESPRFRGLLCDLPVWVRDVRGCLGGVLPLAGAVLSNFSYVSHQLISHLPRPVSGFVLVSHFGFQAAFASIRQTCSLLPPSKATLHRWTPWPLGSSFILRGQDLIKLVNQAHQLYRVQFLTGLLGKVVPVARLLSHKRDPSRLIQQGTRSQNPVSEQ